MIKIVVDSSSDYGFEELQQKDITQVQLGITIEEKSYIEGPDTTRDSFFQILEETGAFPKTSQPSPQDFLDIFEEAKENGDEVVCILLSSTLSGTYQSAVLAKNMVEYDKIYLIDSKAATYIIKIMADYACKLRAEGLSGEVIAKKVQELRPRIKIAAAMDTLEYLYRGGRLNRAAATVGNLANIKPMITLADDGNIGIIGKCIGKNKAISALVKLVGEYSIDTDFPMYSLYSYGTENCVRMEEKLAAAGVTIDERMQIGSTIGSHIGPGAFGIVYVAMEK